MADSRLEERIADSKVRWYFTKEELENSPSRGHNVDSNKELSYRQQTASMIHEMGHRLKLNQICTATAIVYMHRFFIVHSFRTFNRWNIASAALFLAAKVEEQPQKLEYVARVFYACINRDHPNIDSSSEEYKKLIEEITAHELLILETLGFDLRVEHAHPHVVKCTQLVRASKDLSQTAYFMAHNSLLLTTFCLEHPPTVVACCCINLACVWKGIEIPPSQDQKKWWEYVDPDITQELLDGLTKEFLHIYGKSPSKLQKKLNEQIRVAQKQNKLKQEDACSSSSGSQGDWSRVPNPHDSSHTPSTKPSRPPSSNQLHPKAVNHHHRPHPHGAPSDKQPHPPLLPQEKSGKPHPTPSHDDRPHPSQLQERSVKPHPPLPQDRSASKPHPPLPQDRSGGKPHPPLPQDHSGSKPHPPLFQERSSKPHPLFLQDRPGKPHPSLPQEKPSKSHPPLPQERPHPSLHSKLHPQERPRPPLSQERPRPPLSQERPSLSQESSRPTLSQERPHSSLSQEKPRPPLSQERPGKSHQDRPRAIPGSIPGAKMVDKHRISGNRPLKHEHYNPSHEGLRDSNVLSRLQHASQQQHQKLGKRPHPPVTEFSDKKRLKAESRGLHSIPPPPPPSAQSYSHSSSNNLMLPPFPPPLPLLGPDASPPPPLPRM